MGNAEFLVVPATNMRLSLNLNATNVVTLKDIIMGNGMQIIYIR